MNIFSCVHVSISILSHSKCHVAHFFIRTIPSNKTSSLYHCLIFVLYCVNMSFCNLSYTLLFNHKQELFFGNLNLDLLEGESTSVTLFPSAKTAYPVTGDVFSLPWAVTLRVTGIQVTKTVPSWGPGSTRTSIGGSGRPDGRNILHQRLRKSLIWCLR